MVSEVAPLLFSPNGTSFSFLDERKGGKRKSRRQGRRPSLRLTFQSVNNSTTQHPNIPTTQHPNNSTSQSDRDLEKRRQKKIKASGGRRPSLWRYLILQSVNNSTSQHPNIPTTQQLNPPTSQQLNISSTQHPNNSTTQHPNNSTNESDRNLDLEAIDGGDDALVVSVARGAGRAEDSVTVTA